MHQYLVQEAYRFLEMELGFEIPDLKNHMGLNYFGFGDDNYPWATPYVSIGAWQEDMEDIVWGYGFGDNWDPSSTHFWKADDGDDVMTPLLLSDDAENAYTKARLYLFGGHRIFMRGTTFDQEYGMILGRFYSYDSLIDFFKTGHCYFEGYITYGLSVVIFDPQEHYMDLASAQNMSYLILGRVAHLLADMSVPAHVHNDTHNCGFPSYDGDSYELHMGGNEYSGCNDPHSSFPAQNWNRYTAKSQGSLIDLENLSNYDAIRKLFYTLNQLSDHFPSKGDNSHTKYGNNDLPNGTNNYLLGRYQILGPPPASVNYTDIANETFNYAIRATASLLYWFAKECDIIPPAPVIPPHISSLYESPNPICSGTSGYVYCNLSQGSGSINYSWSAVDLPSGISITPMGTKCRVTFYGVSSPETNQPVHDPKITCVVSNSAGSNSRTINLEFGSCGGTGCPTLAFLDGDTLTNENTLLISSIDNPDVDVTDFYLINHKIKPVNKKINFIIHEPETEQTQLDKVELLQVKANPNENIIVTDKGEIITYKIPETPYTITLNDSVDITNLLSKEDSLFYHFETGDVIQIKLGSTNKLNQFNKVTVTEPEYAIISGSRPIIKEQQVARIKTFDTATKNAVIKIKDNDLGNFYLRPNISAVCKNLGSKLGNKLSITFSQDVFIDLFTIVKNNKTARVKVLSLSESIYNNVENVTDKLLYEDNNYAWILPDEKINFAFATQNNGIGNYRYILKTIGRYEEGSNNTPLISKYNTDNELNTIPQKTELFESYPNPFNPSTTIKYQIATEGYVTLKVFDMLGREVATLVNQKQSIGKYEITFDASKLASGLYIYRLKTKGYSQSKKMLFSK